MLAIRMQRTGRKGHAQFRVVVQDSRLSPSSGRVVARLGSYNPHTKETILDTDKAAKYLNNGAQPSERAAFLLKKEGVVLPNWVKVPTKQERAIRNPEKLRRNRPAEEPKEEVAEQSTEIPSEEVTAEAPDAEATQEKVVTTEEIETPAEETVAEDAKTGEAESAEPEVKA